jgi:hypothetical protein
VQYYGWALANRDALLPDRAELDRATAAVKAARHRLKGRLVVDYMVPDYMIPDYHALRPKVCMGGWGRRFITVTSAGKALLCHIAESLPGLEISSVREQSLAAIWNDSSAFARFRGKDWMPEPCRSRDQREIVGRLPVPGICSDRRCVTDRPSVREIIGSRADASGRGSAKCHAAGVRVSPLHGGNRNRWLMAWVAGPLRRWFPIGQPTITRRRGDARSGHAPGHTR